MSFLLFVDLTSISSSFSLSVIAAIPDFLTFTYSVILVFLTIPFLVVMNKYLSFLYFLIGITAVIFSSGISCNKLTIAVPLAVRPDSGISYAFNLYTLPLLVKNIM